jgi:hypothetical protein
VDADIVLNADHMSQPGARFDVKRDYQLNDQQARLMDDARIGIERASGISSGFMGRNGTATSGLQEQTQVEQSTQSLAGLMEAFGRGRALVGECLLSMIIEDIGKEQETVVIEGDTIRPERTVMLNVPEVDPETGVEYLSNDVQRLRLKVALEDVPTSSSFRAQQLTTLGEAVKSMPPAMQAAVMPFMVGLMDLPYKKEVVEAIKAAAAQETPEAVEQRINQAVQDALAKSGNDLKAREVAMKERKADARLPSWCPKRCRLVWPAPSQPCRPGRSSPPCPRWHPLPMWSCRAPGISAPTRWAKTRTFPSRLQWLATPRCQAKWRQARHLTWKRTGPWACIRTPAQDYHPCRSSRALACKELRRHAPLTTSPNGGQYERQPRAARRGRGIVAIGCWTGVVTEQCPV